jgi:hypothetical protein
LIFGITIYDLENKKLVLSKENTMKSTDTTNSTTPRWKLLCKPWAAMILQKKFPSWTIDSIKNKKGQFTKKTKKRFKED